MDTRWIEVDLDKLAHNYNLVRNYLQASVKLLAVVKADAYGHGLVEVGKLFGDLGADYLGVTEIEEGLALRDGGVKTDILVFSPFLVSNFWLIKDRNLTLTLSSLAMIEELGELGQGFKAHLKLETGLGRTGLRLAELPACVALLTKYPQIEVEGVYTHFATAMWSDDRFLKEQVGVFEEGVAFLDSHGLRGLIKHVANSSSILKFPEYHFDLVRAGTVLYGQEGGAYKKQLGDSLRDSWSLQAKITALHHLPAGHGVGYERTFMTKRPTTIAIVPLGYNHGLGVAPMMRSNKLKDVLKVVAKALLTYLDHPRMRVYGQYEGKKVPIVGKIGMQLTMLDVTDCQGVAVGDTIQLPGRRTNISALVEKRFIKGGKVVATSAPSMTSWVHQEN